MKIVICGSMSFSKQMQEAGDVLIARGHQVTLPRKTIEHARGDESWKLGVEESAERKIKYDLIRDYYSKIRETDAILVVNFEKNGIKNYIGANTFLEMGFAHVLHKKIFILNNLPEQDYLIEEVRAMQPILLSGNYEKM